MTPSPHQEANATDKQAISRQSSGGTAAAKLRHLEIKDNFPFR